VERRRQPVFLGNGSDSMRYLTLAGASLLAALFLAACDDVGDDAAPPPAAPQQTPPATQ